MGFLQQVPDAGLEPYPAPTNPLRIGKSQVLIPRWMLPWLNRFEWSMG